MFRRRRKQRTSEPENYKPIQGTSLDSVVKKPETDELKSPKKLDEFKLEEIEENKNDRIVSQSEPREENSPSNNRRVNPVKRPSSRKSTPTNTSKLKSPKTSPKARTINSTKKTQPSVLKVESEDIPPNDEGVISSSSPVSVEIPVPDQDSSIEESQGETTKESESGSVDEIGVEETSMDVIGDREEKKDDISETVVAKEEVDIDDTATKEDDAETLAEETIIGSVLDGQAAEELEDQESKDGSEQGSKSDKALENEVAHQEYLLSKDDPDHPPPRYIEGMHGDMVEARRRWAGTLKWRRENDIETIRKEENPQYPMIRKHYSHFYHGHGKSGAVVLYIRPGKSDFPQLWKSLVKNTKGGPAKQRLVVPEDLVRHHIFMLEHLFQHWGPTVKGINGERATSEKMQRLVAVFDLDGFSFRSLRSFFGVFKKVVQILEQHYVGRADRIMVVNAPNFRNVAYLVYPLVPKEVKAKIEICGRRFQSRLREILVPEEIPKEYGGDSKIPLGEWVLEQHINHMYNHPDKQYPPYDPDTGEITTPSEDSDQDAVAGKDNGQAAEEEEEEEKAAAAAEEEEEEEVQEDEEMAPDVSL